MASQKAPRRKAFALKASEGTPLLRRDIQYDFLLHIFEDDHKVFSTGDGTERINFRDAYVRALTSSTRIAKALREKMLDSPAFATDFAKVSLLANVGRINTTMTFLPEMRTNLRSYHPVPSLQRTDPNLQDAPRIKNILKACHIAGEADALPVTPAELRTKILNGNIPSSNIVNVIFVLSNHYTSIASTHFNREDVDFLDFFMPGSFSSSSRARAFLWLVYHYYQCPDGAPNPFADSNATNTIIPPLTELAQAEQDAENKDTPEEVEYGEKMRQFRVDFLARSAEDVAAAAAAVTEEGGAGTSKGAGKGNAKRRGKKGQAFTVASVVAANSSATPTSLTKGRKRPHAEIEPKREETDIPMASQASTSQLADASSHLSQRRRVSSTPGLAINNALSAPEAAQPVINRHPRYTPAEIASRSGQQRTVFGQALHVLETMDPLADSDGEADDGARYSYKVKLHVLDKVVGPKRERKSRSRERMQRLAVSTSQSSLEGRHAAGLMSWYAHDKQLQSPSNSYGSLPDAHYQRRGSLPDHYQRRGSLPDHQYAQRRPSLDSGRTASYEYHTPQHGPTPERGLAYGYHDIPFSVNQRVHVQHGFPHAGYDVFERRSSIGSELEALSTYSMASRRPSLVG